MYICIPIIKQNNMETNTVVLTLSDYNELREFKEKMEKGNTYVVPQPHTYNSWLNNYSPLPSVKYITTDMAVKELLGRNDKLSAINEELNIECNHLRNSRPNIRELKRMSIWEFIKWRKTK